MRGLVWKNPVLHQLGKTNNPSQIFPQTKTEAETNKQILHLSQVRKQPMARAEGQDKHIFPFSLTLGKQLLWKSSARLLIKYL